MSGSLTDRRRIKFSHNLAQETNKKRQICPRITQTLAVRREQQKRYLVGIVLMDRRHIWMMPGWKKRTDVHSNYGFDWWRRQLSHKRCVDGLPGASGRAGGSTALSCAQRGCIGAFARFARFVSLPMCEAAWRLMGPISGAIQQSGHSLPILLSPIP